MEVFNCFTLVGTREEELEGNLVGAAGVVGQFADGGIVGVSRFEPLIFHTEHHYKSVHVVVRDSFGDGVSLGVKARPNIAFEGQTVTEP